MYSRAPRAFTLVEALAAISLSAIAASALLLGASASLKTTDDAMRETIARGMAQQLIDEVVGCRYKAVAAAPDYPALGPSGTESSGERADYDDVDDFNGFRSQPPTDPKGVPLGTDDGEGNQRKAAFQCRDGFFQNWRQEIDVYIVDETAPAAPAPAGTPDEYRAVEVRIIYIDPGRGERELAKIRRVVAYVPTYPFN